MKYSRTISKSIPAGKSARDVNGSDAVQELTDWMRGIVQGDAVYEIQTTACARYKNFTIRFEA